MTAIRPGVSSPVKADRRTLDAFDGLTAALSRAARPPAEEGAAGRVVAPGHLPETAPLSSGLLGPELRSSLALLFAVLGVPLLLMLLLFG